MATIRITEAGLLIPATLLKQLGEVVQVQRSGAVLIIESKVRQKARKDLARTVRALRQAAQKIGNPDMDAIAAEVNSVRAQRARHY